MLARACANALIISALIDLFVKSISCLAEVFIYRKIDLFPREFFFFPPATFILGAPCQASTGNTL